MVKVALIGAGKMGLSHLAILGAHPEVEVIGVCDTSSLVLDVLKKYSQFPCFSNYKKMIDSVKPDAAIVSVPTRFHASIAQDLIQRHIHLFVEKPFCMNREEGKQLVESTKLNGLVNQVGYHNRFIGTFREVKRLLENNALGDIYHFDAEAYGPVVVKSRNTTWRSNTKEGGGCLMDYASHVIDLVNYLISPVIDVRGSVLKSIFSESVEDSVYSILRVENGVTGVLSVNWSDETFRKMSTSITILCKAGKIIADSNELKVYFKDSNCPEGYEKGWNIKNVTQLTEPVNFYLRGEEYSLQMDYFISSIQNGNFSGINNFKSAWLTDQVIDQIRMQN